MLTICAAKRLTCTSMLCVCVFVVFLQHSLLVVAVCHAVCMCGCMCVCLYVSLSACTALQSRCIKALLPSLCLPCITPALLELWTTEPCACLRPTVIAGCAWRATRTSHPLRSISCVHCSVVGPHHVGDIAICVCYKSRTASAVWRLAHL